MVIPSVRIEGEDCAEESGGTLVHTMTLSCHPPKLILPTTRIMREHAHAHVTTHAILVILQIRINPSDFGVPAQGGIGLPMGSAAAMVALERLIYDKA